MKKIWSIELRDEKNVLIESWEGIKKEEPLYKVFGTKIMINFIDKDGDWKRIIPGEEMTVIITGCRPIKKPKK